MSKDVLELKSSVVYFRFPSNISSKWTEIKFLFVLFCFSRKCQIPYVTQYQLLFTLIAIFFSKYGETHYYKNALSSWGWKETCRSFLVLHSGLNGRDRYLFPRFYVFFMVNNILFQLGVILSIFVKVWPYLVEGDSMV